jgi:phage nucleotide-binding protein
MAMKITKAKDIKKAGATIFLFGESGTGKTSALKTLPGKTLIFDIEGGTSVLRGSDVDIVTIPHSLTGFKEAIDEICLMEKLPYDNVCLDSLTEVQTCMLVAMANASKTQSPTLQDYGIVQFKIRDYCRRLRDLREKGVNVVITALQVALEIEQNEDVTRTCLYPLLMKKLSPEVCGLFDVVAHMEVSSKKETLGKRYFRLDGNESVMAKNRLAKVGDLPYCEADFKKLLA